jgi:small subunit ribosomal protein S6
MPTYETLFITPPNLTEDEELATVEAMAKIVTEGGGQMVANDRMGRRRLAYQIRKFEDGVYTRFLYDSDSAVPTELERRIRLSDKVLRSLTVRLEEDWAEEAKQEAVREAERRVRAEEERAAEAVAEAERAAQAEQADETADDKAAEEAAAVEVEQEQETEPVVDAHEAAAETTDTERIGD